LYWHLTCLILDKPGTEELVVTVRFFAVLKKLVGQDTMQLSVNGHTTLKELLDRLEQDIPSLRSTLREGRTLVAVNQEIAQEDTPVTDGDEVAFLPPFAGGSL
jgi:molybdopterin converting factor subunit 1